MYDELTEVDIKKMQEEINYRTRVLRPQLIEEVQTARLRRPQRELRVQVRQAGQEPQRQPHPLPGADDPHCQGHRGEGPG